MILLNQARTLEEARKEILKSNPSYGYKALPLTSIPFECVVSDTLHIWLRITDKIENLLLKKLQLYG